MTPAWAQRQAELLSDCIVSPNVFDHMVDRLRDFVVPYQRALETEAGQRNVHLYLVGLLSHLDRKNAEKIAALVDVERLVLQEFIVIAQVVKTRITLQLAPAERLREAETEPLHPIGRLHTRR